MIWKLISARRPIIIILSYLWCFVDDNPQSPIHLERKFIVKPKHKHRYVSDALCSTGRQSCRHLKFIIIYRSAYYWLTKKKTSSYFFRYSLRSHFVLRFKLFFVVRRRYPSYIISHQCGSVHRFPITIIHIKHAPLAWNRSKVERVHRARLRSTHLASCNMHSFQKTQYLATPAGPPMWAFRTYDPLKFGSYNVTHQNYQN